MSDGARRETVLRGRPASAGLHAGPLVVLPATRARRVASGDSATEAADLRRAIAGARDELAAMADAADGDGADILAFQVAMLEDEALSVDAFAGVEVGHPADVAWSDALSGEIADYEAAADESFRARASDIADIRDRVLERLAGGDAAPALPPGAVLAADDLTPSRVLSVDWSRGGAVVLAQGSPSAHVAMLARARGVPMVVGLGAIDPAARTALVDGGAGEVVLDPAAATLAAFDDRRRAGAALAAVAAARRFEPARTADGTPVRILLNVADPAELDGLDPALCDGVGLVRTEFLFHGSGGLPGEAAQADAYARIVRWAAGRPVTIRTLDAGGDKPVPGLTIDGETNPFLGVRGVRLSLARPEVFRVQLRALARAAAEGPVKVMLPMVAVADELARAAALLDAAVADLAAEGVPHARPPLGIMVEVPAAALCAAAIPAAFYSIGSNDLTQYVMAAARDIGAVAALNDAAHPAVLDLVRRTVAAGIERDVEVSLCGDAAADPAIVPALLDAGLRVLSVAPLAVAAVKAAVAGHDLRRGAP
ncbi:MAG: putative PEP-binding protein [Rhodospirillales bacterium]